MWASATARTCRRPLRRPDGLGDISLTGLVTVYDRDRQSLILNVGACLPTGSIEDMDQTPASAPAKVQLPYPMQTGWGTLDLLPGVTYLG